MTPSHTLSMLSHACTLALLLACMPTPGLAQAEAAPTGKYACRYFDLPRPGLNFTLLDGGRYADNNGRQGTVIVAGAQITFKDAGLRDLSAVYKGGNPPTFNMMGPNEIPGLLCELVSR